VFEAAGVKRRAQPFREPQKQHNRLHLLRLLVFNVSFHIFKKPEKANSGSLKVVGFRQQPTTLTQVIDSCRCFLATFWLTGGHKPLINLNHGSAQFLRFLQTSHWQFQA
jgi:hypothetical protein